MDRFLTNWADAALISLGFFWMALWAFALGYIISSLIQVFVTRQRMRQAMGKAGPRSVFLGTIFGFLSSSCSFAALATTKSLFGKGAGLVPSLAFLLASTNLVVELGILIAIFLGWQFVVGEYLGGVLLILTMWLVVKLTYPKRMARRAQERVSEDEQHDVPDWRKLATSLHGWRKVAMRYFMEWQMVWKDVSFGFTVAGVIAAFVPAAFFQWLFVGSGQQEIAWWQLLLHTLIGPLAAVFTFIGSMGNIPLAAVLFSSGVSFAGIMAFIFSDLIVFPVVRINAKYYGWGMALYIVAVFLVCIVVAALLMHYGLSLLGLLPGRDDAAGLPAPESRFGWDYTTFLNLGFLTVTALFAWLMLSNRGKPKQGGDGNDGDGHEGHGHEGHGHEEHQHEAGGTSWGERTLTVLAVGSYVWLAGGVALWLAGWR